MDTLEHRQSRCSRVAARALAWLLAGLCVVFLLAPTLAWGGDPPCSEPLERWVRDCAESSESVAGLTANSCPPGMLIISATLGDSAELRVEVRRPAGRPMVTIDDVGISPIGEFPRWAETPPELQAAFAAVVECAGSTPVPTLASGPPRPKHAPATPAPQPRRDDDDGDDDDDEAASATSATPTPPTPVPWLGLAGMLVFVIVGVRRPGPVRVRELYLALGLALACAALQSTLAWSFFLQNGHGPQWVEFALLGHPGLSEYGPGYPELLAALLRLGPGNPEAVLGWVYLGFGVLISLSAYIGARAVGARPALASALLVIVALDPTLVRLLRSAGYHAPIISLLFVSATLLVIATRRTSARTPMFAIAAIGAGLLVAQAARVHPVGWLGASVLPAVILLVPGHTRDRVAQAALATALIGAVVAVTSLSVLVHGLQTPLGRGAAGQQVLEIWPLVIGLLGLAVGAAVVVRWPSARARLLLIAGSLAATIVFALRLNPVAVDMAHYQAGYFVCFAPVLGLGVVSLVSRLAPGRRRQRIAAAVLVAIVAPVSLASVAARTSPATDARESTWALEWRAREWGASQVIYIGSSDASAVALPLYARNALPGTSLSADDIPALYLAQPVIYYRSSLCSAAGREACRALESRLELTEAALLERDLPAIASQSWHPLEADEVRVGLYFARPRGRQSRGRSQ